MYEGQSTKDVADGLKQKGDSAELSKEKTGSIDAKGGYGPGKGGVKVARTKKNSTAIKRNAKGGIDAEGKQDTARRRAPRSRRRVASSACEVGGTKVHKMRTGYEFAIDPRTTRTARSLKS